MLSVRLMTEPTSIERSISLLLVQRRLRVAARQRYVTGPTLLAHALQDALAAVLLEARVERADLREDLVGDLLLLLAGGVLGALPTQRVAVLDGDLGELQPLPVADPRR